MRKPLNPGLGQMILRIVIGVIFVAHGAAKLFGGVGGTIDFFGQLGIPAPFLAAWLVTLFEFVGGIFLIVGLFVLPTAILLAIHMLLGIILVHGQYGFFVIGPGTGGMEFNLLLIAGLLSLLLGGSGYAAVDSRSAAAPVATAPKPAPPAPAAPAPPPTAAAEPSDTSPAEPGGEQPGAEEEGGDRLGG